MRDYQALVDSLQLSSQGIFQFAIVHCSHPYRSQKSSTLTLRGIYFMTARIFRVIVPVTNIDESARFYSRALGIRGKRVSPGRHYFDCDSTILACYDPQREGDDGRTTPNPEPIYLAVDDIRAVFENVKSAGARIPDEVVPGVGPLGEIARRPWGEESFYAEDPFGNPLCFVSRGTVFTGGSAHGD